MKEKSNNHIDPDKAKILIEKAEDTMRLSDYGLISYIFQGFHVFFEKIVRNSLALDLCIKMNRHFDQTEDFCPENDLP
jgi:hypothetical protein